MARVPEAYRGYRATLEEGAAARAVRRAAAGATPSSASWTSGWPGRTSPPSSPAGPEALRAELDAAAARRRRGGRRDPRLPARRVRPAGRGDAGRRRPRALRRRRAPVDRLRPRRRQGLEDAYAWGWAEHRRILAEQRTEAEKVAPRRDPDGGHALARRARPGGRGRRGDPRAAAGDDGRRDRGPGRHALRPRRAGAHGRGDDRAARQRRGAVLHAPGAGLLPARAAPGCRRSGATRFPLWDLVSIWYHEGVPGHHLQLAQWAYVSGAALDVPDVAGLGRRERRGLGAVRRAADGRARLPHRPGRAAGLPRRPAAAGRPGGHRHRHAPAACRSRTTPRARSPSTAGEPWTPELARAFLGRELRRRRRLPRQRAGPLPRHPRAGDQLQAGGAGLAGGPGGGAGGRGATRSTSRPGTWRRCHRARWASTTSPRSSRSSERAGDHGERRRRRRPRPCRPATRTAETRPTCRGTRRTPDRRSPRRGRRARPRCARPRGQRRRAAARAGRTSAHAPCTV